MVGHAFSESGVYLAFGQNPDFRGVLGFPRLHVEKTGKGEAASVRVAEGEGNGGPDGQFGPIVGGSSEIADDIAPRIGVLRLVDIAADVAIDASLVLFLTLR